MKIITSPRVYVSSSFIEKFGSKDIKPAKKVLGFKILGKSMYDSEIKKELGARECTLADVAAFLKNPPKGCDDGYANIFYVSGFVVNVYRVDGEWRVSVWSLDDYRWDAGYRVFSSDWTPENLGAKELGDLEALTLRVQKIEQILQDHKLGV